MGKVQHSLGERVHLVALALGGLALGFLFLPGGYVGEGGPLRADVFDEESGYI